MLGMRTIATPRLRAFACELLAHLSRQFHAERWTWKKGSAKLADNSCDLGQERALIAAHANDNNVPTLRNNFFQLFLVSGDIFMLKQLLLDLVFVLFFLLVVFLFGIFRLAQRLSLTKLANDAWPGAHRGTDWSDAWFRKLRRAPSRSLFLRSIIKHLIAIAATDIFELLQGQLRGTCHARSLLAAFQVFGRLHLYPVFLVCL